MILLVIVLLVMTIISGKITLNKLKGVEQSQRESIQGELLGFFLFYTMFIIMFFYKYNKMRKVIWVLMIALVALVLSSCKKELILEDALYEDKEYMSWNYKRDYVWYGSIIVLKDYLDEDGSAVKIEGVTNIYQVALDEFDPFVIKSTHTEDSIYMEEYHDCWVGNEKMDLSKINLTFQEAYSRIIGYSKPHSKDCALRDYQYIFGYNIYVDAITGEVGEY